MIILISVNFGMMLATTQKGANMTTARDSDAFPGWRLAIGQPFVDSVSSWPDGRFEFRLFGGHQLLQLCLGNLKERDIEAFQRGHVHLGLCQLQQTLFVLFRVEDLMEWSDQAVHIQLVDDAEDRELPPHIPGAHQVLTMVLVEAETGLIRGMRVVTWSKHASAVLHRILDEQLTAKFDSKEHARRVTEIYRHYRNSKQLVRAALLTERAGSQL